MLLTSHDVRLSRRYGVAVVESTVRYGNSLCIIEMAAGKGLSMLNNPPVTALPVKNRMVTAMEVISIGLNGAA